MKKVVILLGLVFLISCGKSDKTKIKIEPVLNHKLEIVDTLIFNNTDSIFIGQFRDMVVKNDTIYISDQSTSNIKIFNKQMKHLKTIGRYGEGPGEFHKAPYLTLHNDTIYAFINNRNIITSLTYNGIQKKRIYNNLNFAFPQKIVFTENKRLLFSPSEENYFLKNSISNVYTSLILNEKFESEIKLDKYLSEVYDGKLNNRYVYGNTLVLTSNGFNNTFMIHQIASLRWRLYNEEGKYIKEYLYKPKYYKNPPDINTSHQFNSREDDLNQFISKITIFRTLSFDRKKELQYVVYINPDNKFQFEYYCLAFNEQGECLFDEPIPGYLADVANGYIYIVTEESPERFVMLKCQLVKK